MKLLVLEAPDDVIFGGHQVKSLLPPHVLSAAAAASAMKCSIQSRKHRRPRARGASEALAKKLSGGQKQKRHTQDVRIETTRSVYSRHKSVLLHFHARDGLQVSLCVWAVCRPTTFACYIRRIRGFWPTLYIKNTECSAVELQSFGANICHSSRATAAVTEINL